MHKVLGSSQFPVLYKGRSGWDTPATPALGKYGQEDEMLEVGFRYSGSLKAGWGTKALPPKTKYKNKTKQTTTRKYGAWGTECLVIQ